MKNKIDIFDTTLRDGAQTPYTGMNLGDRVLIAKALADIGVDVIEAGFAANDVEFEWMKQIAKYIGNRHYSKNKTVPVVCSLARVLEYDVNLAYKSIEPADPDKRRIHVFIGTSEELMNYSHGKREEEIINLIEKNVGKARELVGEQGQVEYSSEDALRTDFDFLVETIQAATDYGANVINVPDTTGFARPDKYYETIIKLRKKVNGIEGITLSAHIHHDSGQSVSSTLKGIEGGIRQVEGTVLQLGERAGNVDWMTVVMNLLTHKGHYNVDVGHIDTTNFYDLAHLVSTIIGKSIPLNHPVVGRVAFTESSGIHVKGVLTEDRTYFVVNPHTVGREKGIALGQTSGKNTIVHFLKKHGYGEYGIDYADDEVRRMTSAVKQYSTEIKDTLTDTEAQLFAEYFIRGRPNEKVIDLIDFHSTNSRDGVSINVELSVDKQTKTGKGTGKGSVDAYMNAMKQALGIKLCELRYWDENAVYHGKGAPGFEILDRMEFSDEELKLIGNERGFTSKGQEAIAKALVGVTYDGKIYYGRGFSKDITLATYEAIIAAFDAIYRLNNFSS